MFIDATDLIVGNTPGLRYGVGVADLDGDGRSELFVAGFGQPNLMLKWDGRALRDAASPVLVDAEGRAIGVAAGDMDGDGQEELYVLNSDRFAGPKGQGDRLFARFGEHWLDLFAQGLNRGVVNRTAGRSVAVVDRFGRGAYGFVVANYGGPLRLYELGPGGRIEDVAEDAGLDLPAGGRSLLSLPISSGRMDIFVGNEGGPNFLLVNMGDGTYEEVGLGRGIADPRHNARGVVALDGGIDGNTEGDGRFDILCANWEGPHRLFRQRPDGSFLEMADAELSLPSRVRTVIAADFDNDGFEEVFFNNIGERNRLFAWRDERWTRIDIGDAEEPGGFGTGAAVADIDGDGRLELVVAHGENVQQPVTLYRPVPNANAWIRVQPLTPAGAPARGAVVLCRAGGRVQRRAVCAGSGYLCQMEPVAHFGLGRTTGVDEVEIRWPTGACAVVRNPPVGRLLTVPHPPA
ncbi:MAG TPA: CRTAC1 family protein [Azospirillaceae bacterium]|nr:CRTAC1 family protein [Azospirillaceae bacterium]